MFLLLFYLLLETKYDAVAFVKHCYINIAMVIRTRAKTRPVSPPTKKISKAQERAVQKLAFNELLQLRQLNGGTL
jgi:hypothetical protein